MTKSSLICILFVLLFIKCNSQSIKVGDIFPDIELKNSDQQTIKLSSLKGHTILVEFWASWCAPCRKSNKSLINLYNKEKSVDFVTGTGLEVYWVSIDSEKNKWIYAQKEDELPISNSVIEPEGLNSKLTRKLNIESIPFNVLLDGNLKVVDFNLKINELKLLLKKLKEK